MNEQNAILYAKETMETQKDTINNFLKLADTIAEQSNQLTATSSNISQKIVQASQYSTDGKEVVQETVKEMEEIQAFSSVLVEKVQILSTLSKSLIEIISNLQQLSSRTNLLALNASIEAARAGDAGRGFNVVAQEVRKLSEQSQASTKKAEQSIYSILEEIKIIEHHSSTGTERTKRGIQNIRQTDEAFQNIYNTIQDVEEQRSQLTAISEHLHKASSQSQTLSAEVANNRKVIAEGLDAALTVHN